MATSSMDITSFVGKLLEQDDVDALREGVRVRSLGVRHIPLASSRAPRHRRRPGRTRAAPPRRS